MAAEPTSMGTYRCTNCSYEGYWICASRTAECPCSTCADERAERAWAKADPLGYARAEARRLSDLALQAEEHQWDGWRQYVAQEQEAWRRVEELEDAEAGR